MAKQDWLVSAHLRTAPSLPSTYFARLGDEVTAVIAAGVGGDLIHFDMMDKSGRYQQQIQAIRMQVSAGRHAHVTLQ